MARTWRDKATVSITTSIMNGGGLKHSPSDFTDNVLSLYIIEAIVEPDIV